MSVGAVVKKEFIQIIRDVRTLSLMIVTPALLLLFFGFVLSFDVTNISLGVIDNDNSDLSRQLVRKITSSEYFRHHKTYFSALEMEKDIEMKKLDAGIIIPNDFSILALNKASVKIQALIDGTDARNAGIVQGFLETWVSSLQNDILSLSDKPAAVISLEPRILYNPELKSSLFLITGLIVFILMITATISTSLSVVREREQGTIESLLVSPLNPESVIVGKTLPYLIIALLSTALIIVTGYFSFGIYIKGSFVLFAVATVFFILAALGQGILISTLTSSQQVAYLVAALSSILPSLLLSGFIFPIRSMPQPIQIITYFIPARYFVEILRGVIIKGSDFSVLQNEVYILMIFTLVLIVVPAIRLKRISLV